MKILGQVKKTLLKLSPPSFNNATSPEFHNENIKQMLVFNQFFCLFVLNDGLVCNIFEIEQKLYIFFILLFLLKLSFVISPRPLTSGQGPTVMLLT